MPADVTLTADNPQALDIELPYTVDTSSYLHQLQPASKTIALPVGTRMVRVLEETGTGMLNVTAADKPDTYTLRPSGDLLITDPGATLVVSRPGEGGVLSDHPAGAGYDKHWDNGYGRSTRFSVAIVPAGSDAQFPVLVRT